MEHVQTCQRRQVAARSLVAGITPDSTGNMLTLAMRVVETRVMPDRIDIVVIKIYWFIE